MSIAVPLIFIPAIKELVHELVRGNYAKLEADGRAGRLTAEMLRQAVEDYGHKLVDLTDVALSGITDEHFGHIKNQNAYWIDIDLWTVDEGRSDLTLQVIARSTPRGVALTIQDLHVL